MEKVKFNRNVHTLKQAATTAFIFDLTTDPLLFDGDDSILNGHYNTYLCSGTEIVASASPGRRVVVCNVNLGEESKLSGFLYVDDGVSIGEKSTIDRAIIMGDDTTIGAGCTIEYGATVGNDGVIGPNASISYDVTVGDNVVLGMGACVSSCFTAGENFHVGPIAFGPDPKKETIFGNFGSFGKNSKFTNFNHKGVAPYPDHSVVFGNGTTFGPGCTFLCPVTLDTATTVGKDAFFTDTVVLDGHEIVLGDDSVFMGPVTAKHRVQFGSGLFFTDGLFYRGFTVKRYLLLDSLRPGSGQVKILLVEEEGELKTVVETLDFFGSLRAFLAEMEDREDVFRSVVQACEASLLQAYKDSL